MPIQSHQNSVPPIKKRRPRWVKITLLTLSAIVLLLIGVGIGAAGNSHTSLINSQKAQIARLRATVATDKSQLSTERLQASTEQAQAKNAMSIALTQVRGQYKSKFAALKV